MFWGNFCFKRWILINEFVLKYLMSCQLYSVEKKQEETLNPLKYPFLRYMNICNNATSAVFFYIVFIVISVY